MRRRMNWLFPSVLLMVACGSGEWGPSGGDSWDDTSWPDGVAPDGFVSGDGVGPDGSVQPGDTITGQDLPMDTAPDLTGPQVVSAFSSDGRNITVRFSEPLESGSAVNVGNYQIKASNNTFLTVTSATINDVFVTLAIDPAQTIDSKLTYEVWVSNVTDLAGNPLDPKARTAKVKRSVYLALIWHQHQPFYVDVAKDELSGPWVRKHSTKDYYDMVSILEGYPDVHMTVNLTAVLLTQLLTYYVDRMGPYVDTANNTVDEAGFLGQWRGHTDPWVDLLLDDTPDPEGILGPLPTDAQKELFYDAPWSCLSTGDALMAFFPEYRVLRDKNPLTYNHADLLLLKIMFEIAWFDPDFLNGPVAMPDGSVVNLSDVVSRDSMGRFTLAVPPSEELANRLVAENFKIMKNVVGIHQKLRFDPTTNAGQIEVTTTPFYHPILPLLVNTELARSGQPYDTLPNPAYTYPDDAFAQVAKGVKFYRDLFGQDPLGMWPGEGSVAEEVVAAFVQNGVQWIATDQEVLAKSLSSAPACYQCYPYRVDADKVSGDGGTQNDEMAMVFRDTGLSNKVGFNFQGMYGQVAAQEFLKDVAAMAPSFGGGDRLVTVVLDGENAWESYTKEHDAKGFHQALYKALQDGFRVGELVPVTVAEYIQGNPARNVPAHPIHALQELEPLWAGSWIGGTYSTWIGEAEENLAWDYLRRARQTLAQNLPNPPNPAANPPADSNSAAYWIYQAYEEMYAAEGSDWFWWYGDDMTSPSNDDTPFDMAFRSHLNGMYTAMNEALTRLGKTPVAIPDLAPIIQAQPKAPSGPFGTPPSIDGLLLPNESEWTSEGGLFFDNDSGAMSNPNDIVSEVYYGYTSTSFYCALATNDPLSQRQGTPFMLELYFSQKHILDAGTGAFTQNPMNTLDRHGVPLDFVTGGAAWALVLDFSAGAISKTLYEADGANHWNAVSTPSVEMGGPVTGGRLLELAIPLSLFEMVQGDPLEFAVVAAVSGEEVERAPNFAGKLVFEDATNLVYVTFEVDATGSTVAIDTYGSITNPLPPAGKGRVMIAGNQDKLGNWVPNKIPLADDGVAPDLAANDNVWTATFGLMPGTLLRYKYTIGVPTDEGRWSGTEEFPLTERGFDVTKDPACKKMKVRDIFADRPSPTGTLGPGSVMNDCVP